MRDALIQRQTAETQIELRLAIDGTGQSHIQTSCGFLDHMLTLFAGHGRMNLDIAAKGDIHVDYHHLVEDTGICLGQAFAQALGERRGITRYGHIVLPMDEALILCAIDLSGRPLLCWDMHLPTAKVGDFDTELGEEFFWGFVRQAGATLHFQQLAGSNSHHILEGAFKGFGRVMRTACSIQPDARDVIPSTKGVL